MTPKIAEVTPLYLELFIYLVINICVSALWLQ
jgi:hypothetical protein